MNKQGAFKEMEADIQKLQAENTKLKEALDKIDRSNDDMKYFNSDIHVIIHELRDELKEINKPV